MGVFCFYGEGECNFHVFSIFMQKHATITFRLLNAVKGLRPIRPDGAMYMMIGIDVDGFAGIADEMEFVQALVREQSVFCLPGRCFDYPNYMRIVLTVPEEMIAEACARIAEFCAVHYRPTATASSPIAEEKGQRLESKLNEMKKPVNALRG